MIDANMLLLMAGYVMLRWWNSGQIFRSHGIRYPPNVVRPAETNV